MSKHLLKTVRHKLNIFITYFPTTMCILTLEFQDLCQDLLSGNRKILDFCLHKNITHHMCEESKMNIPLDRINVMQFKSSYSIQPIFVKAVTVQMQETWELQIWAVTVNKNNCYMFEILWLQMCMSMPDYCLIDNLMMRVGFVALGEPVPAGLRRLFKLL